MSHAQAAAAVDLASLLDDSAAPVYVLDDDRRIVFCNMACARWIGMTVGQLLGQRCAYHSETQEGTPAAVAAQLCPPPKVFSGQPQSAVVARPARDGRVAHRRGHFFPLSDGDDESAGVIAILESNDCPADAPSVVAAADAQLHEQLRRLRRGNAGRFTVESLVGTSPALMRARAQIDLAIQPGPTVLVVGPPGSGKEHVAKTIHYRASRVGPLVPLACGVLETNLLCSTLRSAWSKDSVEGDPAVTLLLSDVDCLPSEAQAALADLLHQGSRHVRLISTSTRPLAELVGQGQFSAALACRLSTISIELAPLVERLEDLPLVAQAFLEQANAGSTKQVGGFSAPALDRLAAYSWPGNLDELAQVVLQAHERATGGEVSVRDLADPIQWAGQAALHPPRASEPIVLEEFLAQVEKELITRALRRAKGNKSKAAKLLGLTRPRLYRRLVQLGMEKPGENPQ